MVLKIIVEKYRLAMELINVFFPLPYIRGIDTVSLPLGDTAVMSII